MGKIKEVFGHIARSRILTVVEGILIIPLAVILLLSLTRIPVVSFGTALLTMMILQVGILTVILLAAAVLLCLASKTKMRIIIACAAISAVFSSAVIIIGNVALAFKEDVKLNIGEALSIRTNTAADIEIDCYYNFNGENIGLSIWKPQNVSEPAPIVIFTHGGGWASGDRFLDSSHCKYFAEQGYMAVSVDYPLSTEERHLWDTQEIIVGHAVQWVAEHANEYGGDKDHIVMTGGSAGGNLTINVATRINNGNIGEIIGTELPTIKAIAVLYPAVYPEATYNHADLVFRASQIEHITKHFGGSPEEYPERYAAITSENLIDKEHTPPMLLVYGSNDHYVPRYSTEDFIDVMNDKGLTYKTVIVPFSDHIFDLLNGKIGSQIYEQTSIKWFELYNK